MDYYHKPLNVFIIIVQEFLCGKCCLKILRVYLLMECSKFIWNFNWAIKMTKKEFITGNKP